jgi:S1-C subfamily serine protease
MSADDTPPPSGDYFAGFIPVQRPPHPTEPAPAAAPVSAAPVSAAPVFGAPSSGAPASYPTTAPPAPASYPVAGQPSASYPVAGQPPAGYAGTGQLPAVSNPAQRQPPVGYSAPASPPAGYSYSVPPERLDQPRPPVGYPGSPVPYPANPGVYPAAQPVGGPPPGMNGMPLTGATFPPARFGAAPVPFGAAPAPADFGAAPARAPRRTGRVLVAVALVLLLVAAGAQGYALLKTNGRLDAANRDRARADAAASARINTLSTRATQLEAQLKAQLDPVGVAAKIAPAVWELDAGDYLGTAWAVRKAAGGGTDLITNYHVVEANYKNGIKRVALVRDKQRINGTVVKAVPGNDLALVHVSQDLPVLTVDSATVVPGEAVLAEGTPLGYESSVSTGIVSNVNRRVRGEHGYVSFFQFDAAINPGNSGGPVVNANGEVVGMASAVFIDDEFHVPAQGMSLAIPIGTVCQVLSVC